MNQLDTTGQKTIRERIEAAEIEVSESTELTGQVDVPAGFSPGTRSFSVTLHNRSRDAYLVTPWHIGPASDAYPNEPDDVLDSLLSDASGFENARSFEDWADEYGYDTDSRKALAMYEECGNAAEALRAFLGDDFEAFLWETDRL